MYFQPKTGLIFLTHSQIRSSYPETSFPDIISDEMLEMFGIFPVVQLAPTYNKITESVTQIAPTMVDGIWVQQWRVTPLFYTQADKDAAVAADAVETHKKRCSHAYSHLYEQYDARVQALAAGYSQYERESWPVQTAEATAYTADPQAATPWLDAASAARGIEKAELAARVLAMDAAYRQIHGALTGHRQKLWDQIAAAQTAEDIAAIDVTAGWPA